MMDTCRCWGWRPLLWRAMLLTRGAVAHAAPGRRRGRHAQAQPALGCAAIALRYTAEPQGLGSDWSPGVGRHDDGTPSDSGCAVSQDPSMVRSIRVPCMHTGPLELAFGPRAFMPRQNPNPICSVALVHLQTQSSTKTCRPASPCCNSNLWLVSAPCCHTQGLCVPCCPPNSHGGRPSPTAMVLSGLRTPTDALCLILTTSKHHTGHGWGQKSCRVGRPCKCSAVLAAHALVNGAHQCLSCNISRKQRPNNAP